MLSRCVSLFSRNTEKEVRSTGIGITSFFGFLIGKTIYHYLFRHHSTLDTNTRTGDQLRHINEKKKYIHYMSSHKTYRVDELGLKTPKPKK